MKIEEYDWLHSFMVDFINRELSLMNISLNLAAEEAIFKGLEDQLTAQIFIDMKEAVLLTRELIKKHGSQKSPPKRKKPDPKRFFLLKEVAEQLDVTPKTLIDLDKIFEVLGITDKTLKALKEIKK